jgi:hypothetical protein
MAAPDGGVAGRAIVARETESSKDVLEDLSYGIFRDIVALQHLPVGPEKLTNIYRAVALVMYAQPLYTR